MNLLLVLVLILILLKSDFQSLFICLSRLSFSLYVCIGRERFHPFTPENHLYYRTPPKVLDWYAKYTLDLKEGYECCSEDSLSFHYVKGDLMLRMYALVYRMCPK